MTESRTTFCSTLSVDLGASCTGTFLISHQNTIPTFEDCRAMTLIMPRNGAQMSYSVQQRRAARHRLRNQKRFTLARRLLLLLVREQLKKSSIELDANSSKALTQSLCGLLRRRGYNRLSSDSVTDLSILESLDPVVLSNHPSLRHFFNATPDVATQWENLTQDIALVGALLKECPNEAEIKAYIHKHFPEIKEDCDNYKKAIKFFTSEGTLLIDQVRFGHRHRTQYLDDILKDMQRDSRLLPAITAFGSVNRLWCLVGNLSNLQLRATRWYFNAPELLNDKNWRPERLAKTLVRAFKYFHFDKGEASQKQQKLIERLEASSDIIDTLCSIDPNETIPPYEDQDNRHPPLDMTLLLSPQRLTAHFGEKWKAWATALARKEPILEENLELILASTDRRSRVTAFNKHTDIPSLMDYHLSYVLQRALDRNSRLDHYALRILTKNVSSQSAYSGRSNLAAVIGSQHVNDFVVMAKIYYDETAKARSGLWIDSHAQLLERSDIHPPKKQSMLPQLVGDVFGLDAQFGRMFISDLWNQRIGSSTVTFRSACQFIETTRKKIGLGFARAYKEACHQFELGITNKNDKELLRISDRIKAIQAFLTQQGLSDYTVQRIANPFSCAQLYTLIELDRAGYSSNCVAIQLENAWRMSQDATNQCAQCSRLPSDPARPFDGVLARVLDRQAYELAKITFEDLKSKIKEDNTNIHLAAIVEENKFAFTADLLTLKGASKKHPKVAKAQNALARQTEKWLSKDERIRQASRSICAYTGVTLGDQGEIDHIIPRSLSGSLLGTAFNSEPNLIFVSTQGNQVKKEQRYFLSSLHPRYLQAVFKTSNIDTIKARIETRIAELHNKKQLQYFDLLSTEDQDCVRHALFLDDHSEARRLVLLNLASINKAKVNGVQAWFLKGFMTKLFQMAEPWLNQHNHSLQYRAFRADANETSDIRTALGLFDPAFKKTEFQGIASHSIDAMCAYASLCASDNFCSFTRSNRTLANTESSDELRNLYPEQTATLTIESKPIQEKTFPASKPLFKEGIYGEHFLPITVVKNRVYVGFTLPKVNGSEGNSLLVGGKNPLALVQTLDGYLDKPFEGDTQALRCYRFDSHKVFALLNKAATKPEQITDHDAEVLKIVEALYYTTKRIPVTKRLLDKNLTFVRPEDKKTFHIAISLKSKAYRVSGKLILPAKAEWDRIFDHPNLQDKYGKKLKDFPNFDLEEWLLSMFHANSSKREHTPIARFSSLPVCDTPSGGFRIRRKTLDGQPVFQLYAYETGTLRGFSANELDQIDWDRPVFMPHLCHDNVTPKKRDAVKTSKSIIRLNEFRKIGRDNEITVYMAPNSKTRPLVRLVMPFTTLQEWLKNAEATCQPNHPYELPTSVKLNKPERFISQQSHWHSLLTSPRKESAYLNIENVGKVVQITYQASGSNTWMRTAYNNIESIS